MPKYIDTEKVEKEIAAIMPSLTTPDGSNVGIDDCIMSAQEMCFDAMTIIHNHPAADVAEVKHGEWKRGNFTGFGYSLYCNCCGMVSEDETDYCPHCGARMDGAHYDIDVPKAVTE